MATTSSTPRASRAKASTAGKKAAATRKRTAAGKASTTATQVRQIAGRGVDVPVGASLVARDSLVSTVRGLRGLAETLGDRATMERELQRYEKRGAGARNRFEGEVRRTRTTFEREVRQRRARVTRLVNEAQHRIGSLAQ